MSEPVKPIFLAPQTQAVLEYLRSGRSLSVQIAINTLKVGSLTKRISELRNAGFEVVSEWAKDHFGGRYKKYSIKQGQAE